MSENQSLQMLSADENNALKILTYFYFQMNHIDSAYRGAKALLAIEPKNLWAKAMIVMCADAKEDFEEVLSLSDPIEQFKNEPDLYRSVVLLRARSLQKEGYAQEARQTLMLLSENV